MAYCIAWGLFDTNLKLIKCIGKGVYWCHQFDVVDVAFPLFPIWSCEHNCAII